MTDVAWDRAGPPPSHCPHVFVTAEVVDGPSHIGDTFIICALCGALAPDVAGLHLEQFGHALGSGACMTAGHVPGVYLEPPVSPDPS